MHKCVTKDIVSADVTIRPWRHSNTLKLAIPAGKEGTLLKRQPERNRVIVLFIYLKHRVRASVPADMVRISA